MQCESECHVPFLFFLFVEAAFCIERAKQDVIFHVAYPVPSLTHSYLLPLNGNIPAEFLSSEIHDIKIHHACGMSRHDSTGV
jgi:hypothetical protein